MVPTRYFGLASAVAAATESLAPGAALAATTQSESTGRRESPTELFATSEQLRRQHRLLQRLVLSRQLLRHCHGHV